MSGGGVAMLYFTGIVYKLPDIVYIQYQVNRVAVFLIILTNITITSICNVFISGECMYENCL